MSAVSYIFKKQLGRVLSVVAGWIAPVLNFFSSVRLSRVAFLILVGSIAVSTADIWITTARAMISVFRSVVNSRALAFATGGGIWSGFSNAVAEWCVELPWIIRKLFWGFGFDWILWGFFEYFLILIYRRVMKRVARFVAAFVQKTTELV